MHPIGVGYRRIRIGRPFGAAQRHQVAVTAGLHRLSATVAVHALPLLADKLNAGAGFGFRATGGVAPYGFQFIDGRRAWHQGEQETLAAIIEHRAAGPLMGEGGRQAQRHRAPHSYRRPVDAPGRPPGPPGAGPGRRVTKTARQSHTFVVVVVVATGAGQCWLPGGLGTAPECWQMLTFAGAPVRRRALGAGHGNPCCSRESGREWKKPMDLRLTPIYSRDHFVDVNRI